MAKTQPNRIVKTKKGSMRSRDIEANVERILTADPTLTNDEIARKIGINGKTADKHAATVREKLREAPREEDPLVARIKALCNLRLGNTLDIWAALGEPGIQVDEYGNEHPEWPTPPFADVPLETVEEIVRVLIHTGEVENPYASSSKLVHDKGKKREIKKDLNPLGYRQKIWREEDAERFSKKDRRRQFGYQSVVSMGTGAGIADESMDRTEDTPM